eukprot:gene5466-7569_t
MKDIILEAINRSITSYSSSLALYHERVSMGYQPSTSIQSSYTTYVELRDPRVPWRLLGNLNIFDFQQQNELLAIMNSLYLIVTVTLFLLMKRRKTGFRLRWVLVTYDALNVGLAFYIAASTLAYKLKHNSLILCNPIRNDKVGYKIAHVFVLFYLQKYLEYFDTWFFLLRKSSRQVTFLHLFHHSSITVVVGSILPFDYNGDMYLPILLNSANHMMVYLHYLLATLGLRSWWAPYITSMQLLQFIAIFAQSLISYIIGPECGSPDFAKVLMIVYMGSMVALFGNFFLQKYVLGKSIANLDLCGVIKRPEVLVNTASQHCGTVMLDSNGSCTIILPEDFPDAEQIMAGSIVSSSFHIVYNLTPIGAPMPSLHISTEVSRYNKLTSSQTTDNYIDNDNAMNSEIMLENDTDDVQDFKYNNNSSLQMKRRHHRNHSQVIPKRNNNDKANSSNSTNANDRRSTISNSNNNNNNNNNNVKFLSKISSNKSSSSLHTTPLPQAMPKSASFSDFSTVQYVHNDRLIDGPILPLLDKYSRHFGGIALRGIVGEKRCEPVESNESTINVNIQVENSNHAQQYESYNNNINNNDSQQVELCFGISGGVPDGKVSWMITTVPKNQNISNHSYFYPYNSSSHSISRSPSSSAFYSTSSSNKHRFNSTSYSSYNPVNNIINIFASFLWTSATNTSSISTANSNRIEPTITLVEDWREIS